MKRLLDLNGIWELMEEGGEKDISGFCSGKRGIGLAGKRRYGFTELAG